ncbi:S-layer homology domain-containing protein [Candidatus Peregrinibacteria bacterium]|nr:S-layer homology domain-containing protein [Candidatus Peregrinibacteria bacterium]
MKTKLFFAILFALIFPVSVFAISAPTVNSVPSSVDADIYTLTIHTEPGATVSVLGGPSFLAPITDGVGDEEDGIIHFDVGLAQNTENVFSITAEKDGVTSSSILITINEEQAISNESGSSVSQGEKNVPDAPTLKPIPETVDTAQYILSGNAEPDTNIYVRNTQGDVVGSTHASSATGLFQVTVQLEQNKTNRFNISAEYESGGEGSSVQAVIRQVVDLPEPVIEEEPELVTSSQMFFEDTKGHWAEGYIQTLYDDEVVSGKTETTFEPNKYITRAELTKIALLAFGYSVNATVKEHPFSDVPKNSWFAPYVEEAKNEGIVSGYPSGGFGPNEYINRAAAMKILIEAAGFDVLMGSVDEFTDVPSSAWYSKYVAFAYNNKIVAGYPDGTFGPEKNITRAEVAKIVVKIMEMKE